MKFPAFFILCQLCTAPLALAQTETDPSLVSPDGRFVFEAFSSEDVDAGKRPAFGIVEIVTGKLVSNPEEELGDTSRPEETILWAPDSLAYALTCRVGTRHVETFLYRWEGDSFVRARWEGDALLEAMADRRLFEGLRRLGYTKNFRRGQVLAGDTLPERWLDPRRLVLIDNEEGLVSEDDKEDVAAASARAVIRWDEAPSAYVIDHELPVAESWPEEIGEDSPYEITQTDLPGDDPNAKKISVRHRETSESKQFDAEGWMTFPSVRIEENGWPQIELISRGPDAFVWRKLFRVVEGGYRCIRIDEMTGHAHQAPEGAPLVALAQDYSLFLIRSRIPDVDADAPDTFESFQSETVSPDGKWKTVFTYTPQYLQRVEIVDSKGAVEPVILYDFDSGEGSLETVCQALWRPDSGAFAFFTKEGPRAGHTLLYRQDEGGWPESTMPEIDYSFLKATLDAGINWRQQFETPLWWNHERELVLELRGTFRGEEAPDYLAHALLHWDKAGVPSGSETRPLSGSAVHAR